MNLSVVVPVFNEEKNVEPLHDKIKKVLEEIGKEYEIIFVDDGSKDGTFENLLKIHNKEEETKIIKGSIYS